MATFNCVIILGGICGLLMVVGGMVLLYRGNITLSQKSAKEAVSLEFKNMIKITTHYPALGLFIIGLAFIIVSAIFSKPTEVKPLEIVGRVNVDDTSAVTLAVYSRHGGTLNLNGKNIDEVVTPVLDVYKIEITAAGYIQ
jgi:hypothetical protein